MGRSESRMVAAEHRRAMYKPDHHTQQDIRTLGILFFMETHRRILGGRFGSIPAPLKVWAFAEGGYCLDAPDMLPAGGSEFFALDPTGMEDSLDEFGNFGLPQQLTVPREPDDTAGVATDGGDDAREP